MSNASELTDAMRLAKPRLKYRHCFRGNDVREYSRIFREDPTEFERIKSGPLKGCIRRTGAHSWRYARKPYSVFALRKTFVLEFSVVIRIEP